MVGVVGSNPIVPTKFPKRHLCVIFLMFWSFFDVDITLPDGSVRQYESPVTVAQIAASIGAGLAKATVAGKVNGKLVDACDPITEDSTVQIHYPERPRRR